MTEIFLDSASKSDFIEGLQLPDVRGFTTNPSLMKKAGVTDYEAFAKELCSQTDKPISFEILASSRVEMELQARKIAGWAPNVWVKIPIVDYYGLPTAHIIGHLVDEDLKINVTAVMTESQIESLEGRISESTIVSIFCGRISDAGYNPKGLIEHSFYSLRQARILWASPRCIWDYYWAKQLDVNIITLPLHMIKKMEEMKGCNLAHLSLKTVQQFTEDAKGLSL